MDGILAGSPIAAVLPALFCDSFGPTLSATSPDLHLSMCSSTQSHGQFRQLILFVLYVKQHG